MKKIFLITFVMLLLMSLQVAAIWDMCEDEPEINVTCTMLTPSLNCTTYNYTIFNLSGNITERANLTLLKEDIYFFNFTQSKGGYIVKLCDGTTREVFVKEDDNMILAVILGIAFISGLLMFISLNIDREHTFLKFFFTILSLGLLMVIPSSLMNGSTSGLTTLFKVCAGALTIFIVYFITYFVFNKFILKTLSSMGVIKKKNKR